MDEPESNSNGHEPVVETRQRCGKCGYNLTGLKYPPRCPECGMHFDAVLPWKPGPARGAAGAILMGLVITTAIVTTYITLSYSPDYYQTPSPSGGSLLFGSGLKPGALPVLALIIVQFPLTVLAVLLAASGIKTTRRKWPFVIAAGITCAPTATNFILARVAGFQVYVSID